MALAPAAINEYKKAIAQKPDAADVQWFLYEIAFVENDAATMARLRHSWRMLRWTTEDVVELTEAYWAPKNEEKKASAALARRLKGGRAVCRGMIQTEEP